MKISVVTGKGGEVVATLRHDEKARKKNSPTAGFIPARGQKLHELELPSALEDVKSAEELHQALKAHLKKTSSKERAPTKKR